MHLILYIQIIMVNIKDNYVNDYFRPSFDHKIKNSNLTLQF